MRLLTAFDRRFDRKGLYSDTVLRLGGRPSSRLVVLKSPLPHTLNAFSRDARKQEDSPVSKDSKIILPEPVGD